MAGWAAALGAISGSASTPTAVAHGALQGRLGRKFAKYMYQHRYQWAVQDLRKAGLNPILAAGTSPGGVNAPQAPGGIPSSAGAMVAAKEAAILGEKIRQEKATTKMMEADAALKDVETEIKTDIGDFMSRLWSSGKDVKESVMKLAPVLTPNASSGEQADPDWYRKYNSAQRRAWEIEPNRPDTGKVYDK